MGRYYDLYLNNCYLGQYRTKADVLSDARNIVDMAQDDPEEFQAEYEEYFDEDATEIIVEVIHTYDYEPDGETIYEKHIKIN